MATPSGLFEFECQTLKRFDADDPERPPILKYDIAPESPHDERAKTFPLQLPTPHSRFSFHTHGRTMCSGGHGLAGVGRRRLLNILQDRAVSLGVDLRFESEVADIRTLDADTPVTGTSKVTVGWTSRAIPVAPEAGVCALTWGGAAGP